MRSWLLLGESGYGQDERDGDGAGPDAAFAGSVACAIFALSAPVLRIDETGVWIMDEQALARPSSCLFLVAGADGVIRYVGTSGDGMLSAERRESDSLWAQHIELERARGYRSSYDVRCIAAERLAPILHRFGPPVSEFAVPKGMAEAVKCWLSMHCAPRFLAWNAGEAALTHEARSTLLH